MAYIVGLVVTTLLFLAMHYFTELSRYQKIVVSVAIFTFIVGAGAYNSYTKKQQQDIQKVVLKFKQGKSITCNGIEVNSTNFTLSIGTYTFIGKKGTPHYAQMISASTCK